MCAISTFAVHACYLQSAKSNIIESVYWETSEKVCGRETIEMEILYAMRIDYNNRTSDEFVAENFN